MILDLNLTWKSASKLVWQVSPEWNTRSRSDLCKYFHHINRHEVYRSFMALFKLTIMPELLHTLVIYSVKSKLPLEHILLHGNCFSLFMNSNLPAIKYLIQWKGAQNKALHNHLFLFPMKRSLVGFSSCLWIVILLALESEQEMS